MLNKRYLKESCMDAQPCYFDHFLYCLHRFSFISLLAHALDCRGSNIAVGKFQSIWSSMCLQDTKVKC